MPPLLYRWVVHVLDNGNPIGQGGNLSVAQIQSQIDVLNEDFRKLNADRVNTAPPWFVAHETISFNLHQILHINYLKNRNHLHPFHKTGLMNNNNLNHL